MLQNAYFLAKIGADTAENEQHFAEILSKTGNYPTGPPGRRGLLREGPEGHAAVDRRARRPAPRRKRKQGCCRINTIIKLYECEQVFDLRQI